MKAHGVLMGAKDDTTVRAVTHYMCSAEAIDYAVKIVRDTLENLYD